MSLQPCSKCGRTGKAFLQGGGGAKLFLGTPEQMKPLVFKCYGCGKLVRGSCSAVEMGVGTMFKCPDCRGDMGPCDSPAPSPTRQPTKKKKKWWQFWK